MGRRNRTQSNPPAPSPAESTKRIDPRIFIQPFVLFIVSIVVYLPSLKGGFIWDDQSSIANNSLLRDLSGLRSIWTTIGRIPGEAHYWPVTYTALWLQYHCWADWGPGYHIVNSLLHGAVVLQIWRLMRRSGLPGAFMGAAFFAVHPVHVEAVAWTISIKDLLATLFYLLTIEFCLNYEQRGRAWLIAALVTAIAAMLSKSSPIMLPAAIALLIWYRGERFSPRRIAAIAMLAVVILSIAAADMSIVNRVGEHANRIPPLSERLINAGYAFWFYLAKLVWPFGLSPVYPRWPDTAGWIPLVLIAPATAGLWLPRGRIGRGPLAC